MEIDQLTTFVAVATVGGFHRAAETLRVSQPAVRSGLTLTEAGRILRPYAEQLLKTASLARQAVHELKPASGGPLQIAAALSISVYFLPDVLKRFQRAHPKVIIAIRPGHSKEVLEKPARGMRAWSKWRRGLSFSTNADRVTGRSPTAFSVARAWCLI